MNIYSTYSVKIKEYRHVFKETVTVYRNAVDFFIEVCLNEWYDIFPFSSKSRFNHVEKLTHKNKG